MRHLELVTSMTRGCYMHAYEGQYHVVTYSRQVQSGEYQARADIYHLSDKEPSHCVYPSGLFASKDCAKSSALRRGLAWAEMHAKEA